MGSIINIIANNVLFRNVAKVPSEIDSPIKGTTASTRSPEIHDNTVKHRFIRNAKAQPSKHVICNYVPLSEENDLVLNPIKDFVRISSASSLKAR